MRGLLLTLAVSVAVLAFAPGAWADLSGEPAADPAMATVIGVADDTQSPPLEENTLPPADVVEPETSAPPPEGIPTPPASDTAPPLPAEAPPTPPAEEPAGGAAPAPVSPPVLPTPPVLPEEPPPVPVNPEPDPVAFPVAVPTPQWQSTPITTPVRSTVDDLFAAAQSGTSAHARTALEGGEAARTQEIRPTPSRGLFRSAPPGYKQVGGSASGGGGPSGAGFSPDNSSARTLIGVLLLALMGTGLIVSARSTVPSSVVLLGRLERPG